MRRILVVLLLVAMSVVLASARPAYACSCGQPPHTGDQAFVGVAEHVDGLPLFGDPESSDYELTTRFRVESVLGDSLGDHVEVRTKSQGTACGFVFEKGYRYQVYATDAAAEDEDPVIDPDGCAWIAGGLERFVEGHQGFGDLVTFDSVASVLRAAVAGGRLAEQQLRWLDHRLAGLRDDAGNAPHWSFARTELAILAGFYRRCAERGFAVYADY